MGKIIAQINRFKDKALQRCSTFCRSSSSDSDEPTPSHKRNPSRFVAVYVGPERRLFVIPTRFLKYPVFEALLGQTKEELRIQASGGLALPCEIWLFQYVLWCIEEGEATGSGDFAKMAFDVDLKTGDFTPLHNNAS